MAPRVRGPGDLSDPRALGSVGSHLGFLSGVGRPSVALLPSCLGARLCGRLRALPGATRPCAFPSVVRLPVSYFGVVT